MKINKLIQRTIFIALLLVATSVMASTAQITFPDDVDDETPAAPIDGFIAIGIAAGAYFGIRKKISNTKEN